MRGDYDANKVLVSVAEALINLFLAFLLIIVLLYLALVLMAGVEDINDVRKFVIEVSDIMTASSDIMISLLIIAGVALALAFLVMFVCWLSKDEKGIIILPFEVSAGKDKYSGKALSNLLITELLRIGWIQDFKAKYKGLTPIESEYKGLTPITPIEIEYNSITHKSSPSTSPGSFTPFLDLKSTNENLTYAISQLGPLSLGTTSIHIGPLVAILKRLWPRGDGGQVISGSLQKYGLVINLLAHLEHPKIRAWEVRHEIRPQDKIRDEQIPSMIRDLAFKIFKDLSSEQDGQARTWQALKHITEAWDAYYQYTLTEDEMELERAQESCFLAAKAEVGYKEPFDLILNLGYVYHNKRRYNKAEKLFLQAVALDQNNVNMLFGLAVALDELNQYKDAIEYYDRVIRLNPYHAESWSNKGESLRRLGKYKEAIECFDEAIDLNSEYFDAWYNKGIALTNLSTYEDRFEEAIKSYNKAIQLNDKSEKVWNNKGVALVGLKQWDRAIECFDKAIALDPEKAISWFNKGVAFLLSEHYREAIGCFDKAATFDKKFVAAWINKGVAHYRLDEQEQAIKAFKKATKFGPKDFNAWYNLAKAYFDQKIYTEAISAFKKSIELNPEYYFSYLFLGISYLETKKYHEAIKAFEKALELSTENYGDIWYHLGVSYSFLGQDTSAIIAYENVKETDTYFTLARMALARLYRKLGKETESVEACKTARDLIETESEYNRACFEAVCGSPDAALDLLRTVLEKKQQTADFARQDPDFEFIRDDPRFEALLDEFSVDRKEGPE